MCFNLQIRYIVDSWVEFVSRRKAVTNHESKETGHYICYKYVNGILLRFDDALVNQVDMLSQYHINLILYRRYDIDPHKWEIDLGFVAHLNQVTYGLRCPAIHGTRYSLCHTDITQDEQHPNGSIIVQKENTDNVGKSAEQPLDMTSKDQDQITMSLTSHEEPVDMTVSSNNNHVNRSDNSDPKNLEQSDDILHESDQLEQPDNSNLSQVDIEENGKLLPNIPQEVLTSEQLDPAINVDSGNSEVKNKVTLDENENPTPNISQELLSSQQVHSTITGDSGNSEVNIELPDREHSGMLPDQQNEAEETVDSSCESQLEGDPQKSNNNSLENTTPDASNSKEDVIGNSSPKAADCLTEVDSQGKIQLSEFNETVDYNTGEMSDEGNSSSSSSSGRSEDESDRDQPVNERRKPDLSLRPPLITKSTGNT